MQIKIRKMQKFFEGVSVLFALQMVEEVGHLTKESHSSIRIIYNLKDKLNKHKERGDSHID